MTHSLLRCHSPDGPCLYILWPLPSLSFFYLFGSYMCMCSLAHCTSRTYIRKDRDFVAHIHISTSYNYETNNGHYISSTKLRVLRDNGVASGCIYFQAQEQCFTHDRCHTLAREWACLHTPFLLILQLKYEKTQV